MDGGGMEKGKMDGGTMDKGKMDGGRWKRARWTVACGEGQNGLAPQVIRGDH